MEIPEPEIDEFQAPVKCETEKMKYGHCKDTQGSVFEKLLSVLLSVIGYFTSILIDRDTARITKGSVVRLNCRLVGSSSQVHKSKLCND